VLTSLDFLQPGKPWPPPEEGERLRLYSQNRKLFEGKHAEVFDSWIKLLRDDQQATLEIILNWHRRLSTLWADLLLGEPPHITAGDQGSAEQVAVDRLVDDNGLINTAYEAAIDISRFGTGLFKVSYNGRSIITGQQPAVWFPVVKPDNIKEITAHVLAYEYKEGKAKYLKAEIHERGKITTTRFSLNENTIEAVIDSDELTTGVDDFLVVPANNILTTDRITGLDDYSDLDSIIQEIEIRVAQISRILDKHADPNMYGPDSALEQDPKTGEWTFRGGGKYFPVSDGEDAPGYVVWEGQLEAAFKQIEVLMEQLYILSETSAAAFGQLKSGLAESGTALRRLMMAPLAKTNRIRLRFDPAIKKALKLAAALEVAQGMSGAVKIEHINIDWQDGLPDDEPETTQTIATQKQSGLISLEAALRKLHGLEGEALEQEVARIRADADSEVPLMYRPSLNREDPLAGDD